jgi:hypothetical protein
MQRKIETDREKIAFFLKKYDGKYRKKIAALANRSWQLVAMWFQGKSDNEDITNAVIQFQGEAKLGMQEKKQTSKKKTKKISQLATEVTEAFN